MVELVLLFSLSRKLVASTVAQVAAVVKFPVAIDILEAMLDGRCGSEHCQMSAGQHGYTVNVEGDIVTNSYGDV